MTEAMDLCESYPVTYPCCGHHQLAEPLPAMRSGDNCGIGPREGCGKSLIFGINGHPKGVTTARRATRSGRGGTGCEL